MKRIALITAVLGLAIVPVAHTDPGATNAQAQAKYNKQVAYKTAVAIFAMIASK